MLGCARKVVGIIHIHDAKALVVPVTPLKIVNPVARRALSKGWARAPKRTATMQSSPSQALRPPSRQPVVVDVNARTIMCTEYAQVLLLLFIISNAPY